MRDDEPELAGEVDEVARDRHHPPRVDDGDPDPLVAEPLGDLEGAADQCTDRDDQHVLGAASVQHVGTSDRSIAAMSLGSAPLG